MQQPTKDTLWMSRLSAFDVQFTAETAVEMDGVAGWLSHYYPGWRCIAATQGRGGGLHVEMRGSMSLRRVCFSSGKTSELSRHLHFQSITPELKHRSTIHRGGSS